MKLIVGLGNPGFLYAGSRHNIGFRVIKSLAKQLQVPLRRQHLCHALGGIGTYERTKILLALPLTYMNLSGKAVRALLEKEKIHPSQMLVIYDDVDLEFGRLKIRAQGSDGGHRGISSIIEELGHNSFCRLRIGIGRPSSRVPVAEYVLGAFSKTQQRELPRIIEEAADCGKNWATDGITKAMNTWNERIKREKLKRRE
ncbi:MAG: aminoacyl-tRNA hydrolase [Candidatus Omnitrophica bacterium]|nr:aminoacyl-tRNA hydrolase [Candidatus Omnitrophota bacterium]